ncbi:MAG: hypothetical protein CVV37_06490 [Nitrospira bacterium HGW-Nitrospira-1]|nr:MAG: hypothetical protein CVV37_06490 [Nitrospira bacterium HGW-Nitrospira-1]
MSLRSRFGLWLGGFFLLCLIVAIVIVQRHFKNEVEREAYETCRLIVVEVDSIQRYVRETLRPTVETLIGKEEFVPEAMSTTFVSRKIVEKFLDVYRDYYFKFADRNPRNPLNLADDKELELIKMFKADPKLKEWRGIIKRNGMPYFTVAMPIIFEKTCMRCHTYPEDSPASLTRRYGTKGGFAKNIGDISLKSVGVPVAEAMATAEVRTLVFACVTGVFVLGLFIFSSFLFGIFVIKPMNKLKEGARVIGEGNLSHKVRAGNKDEVEGLSSEFNLMAQRLGESRSLLVESGKKFRRLYNNVPDMLCSVNRDGIIMECNDAMPDTLGYKKNELIGNYMINIISPEFRNIFHQRLSKVKTNGGYEGECIYIKNGGERLPVFTIAKPMFDEQGNFIYTDTIIRDITDIKRVEEERNLLQTQLLQSQKMEAMGRLAGGIAHDFNNILTAIIGYSSILMDKMKKDDPNRHRVQIILESGERATHLTQSLLAFSRKQTINKMPVDLNGIIKKMGEFLLGIIGEDIELKTITTLEKGIMVFADAGQIEQVIVNLATNARDAMPEGGTLTIGAEVVEIDKKFADTNDYGKPGDYALLTISDTGVGMDEGTRLRIFEPFFTTKEFGKGTGLGLSIVYGIVKQHDGFINVYSEPGKGATFKIYLPITKEMSEEEMPAEGVAEDMRGAETILVAEDDSCTREFIKFVLEEAGYTVIEAVDGDDALNKFKDNKDKIELLVLDVVMPGMAGTTVYDRIVKIKPDIKTLFLSGYPPHIRNINGKETGFISKPVMPAELLKKVKEVIGK